VIVCKTAFLCIHDIAKGKINHIVDQHKSGLTSARPSKRGKHDTRPNRVSKETPEFVRDHICSYLAEASHYSRQYNPNRLYLLAKKLPVSLAMY